MHDDNDDYVKGHGELLEQSDGVGRVLRLALIAVPDQPPPAAEMPKTDKQGRMENRVWCFSGTLCTEHFASFRSRFVLLAESAHGFQKVTQEIVLITVLAEEVREEACA